MAQEFKKLCEKLRTQQGESTVTLTFPIRSDLTLTYELNSNNSQTKPRMSFVLYENGIYKMDELYDDLDLIWNYLNAQKLTEYTKQLINQELNL